MNTVGIFAGRGDVILAMGMALLFGIWLGPTPLDSDLKRLLLDD